MATTEQSDAEMSSIHSIMSTMTTKLPDLVSSMLNETILNTTTTTTTKAPAPAVEAVEPTSMYDYDTATFEIILPCIFGIFVTLTLSLVMFYTKYEDDSSEKSKHGGGASGSKKGLSKLFQTNFDNTEWENVTNSASPIFGY